jgi:tRNA nucleotidyltransferase/poly(A) polymerase
VSLPEHLLDAWSRRVLHAATEAANRTHARAFLVGGAVRDLLRGTPTGDPDLVVEGDAAAFARELAQALGARLTATERFLTWRLWTDDGFHVDVARTRSESYPGPGVLPVVRPAESIEEDLARRDFTVNAMALRLSDRALVDPFGGRTDLDAVTLRFLHDRSFIDDPTRIFRAIRLSTRCSLSIESRTADALDDAVRSGALATVSADRLWKEIALACAEPAPVAVLRALGARRCLLPVPGAADASGLDALADDLRFPAAFDAKIALLGALLRRGSPGTLEALPFDRSTANRIRTIATRSPSLGETLACAADEASRFAACENSASEERFLAAAERPAAAVVITRFDAAVAAGRTVRGDDLGVPPGPWIAKALRDTRLALFAGRIEEREAPAFARRRAMEYLDH